MTTSRTDQLIDTWDRLTTSVNSPPLRTATPRSVHAPLGAALVGAIVLAAVLVQGRLGIAAPGPTTATATPTRTPSAPVAPATPPQVPSTCQPTEPIHPFVAPAGSAAPVRPPQDLDAEWFGSARLWTLLRHGGEIWYGLPREAAGLGQKTFWWSADFDVNRERQPEISVSGRQLDGLGRFAAPAPGTHAFDPALGPAMLVGIDVPTTGCWQITANYRHASLSFVAWVSG